MGGRVEVSVPFNSSEEGKRELGGGEKVTNLLALRVPHGLVDTEDQASGLDG